MRERKPRFTDKHRFPHGPYADAKASEEPNYLRDKFSTIRKQQEVNEAETKDKVRDMTKRKTA